MGKKKKKIDKMDFDRGLMNFAGDTGGSKEAKELHERYNVEGYRHGRTDRGSTYRGFDEVKKDLSAAMMNDYDTRRTIEAAAMSGNKDAKKFAKKGIEGVKGMLGAHGLLKDLKKEHVGGGGMNSPENRASLTHALVQHDREKQTEGYRDEFASKDALSELEDKLKKGGEKVEEEKLVPEKSEQTLKDEATVEYWDENFATGGIYGEPGDDSGKGPRMSEVYKEYGSPLLQPMIHKRKADEKDAATTFLDAYKRDLFQGGSALMPEI